MITTSDVGRKVRVLRGPLEGKEGIVITHWKIYSTEKYSLKINNYSNDIVNKDDCEFIDNDISTLKTFAKLILELCYQIEKCGCSPELTQASIMASSLLKRVNEFVAEKH